MTSGSAELVVIDDDPADLLLLREILDGGEVVGMRMQQADSLMGGEALIGDETLCILLDNVLPDGLGLDVIERVRDSWPDVALIMMTGSGDEMTSVEALKKGADDYLPKSQMTPSRLADAILSAVDKKKLAQAMRAKNDELALLAELIDSAEDMLFVVDCARESIVHANAAARRALDAKDKEAVALSVPVSRLFRSGYAAWVALRDLLARTSPGRFETVVNSHGYLGRPVEISARLVLQGGSQYVVGVARDISAQLRLQAELLENASIDPQTELPTLGALQLQLQARQAAGEDSESSWLVVGVGLPAKDRTCHPEHEILETHWRVRIAATISAFASLHQGHPGVLGGSEFLVAVPEPAPMQTEAFLAGLRADLDLEVEEDSDVASQASPIAVAAVRSSLAMVTDDRTFESLLNALRKSRALRTPVPVDLVETGDKPDA